MSVSGYFGGSIKFNFESYNVFTYYYGAVTLINAQTFLIKMATTYQRLKTRCELVGISLKELCDRGQVPVSRIYNWRDREPDALKTLRKLETMLDEAAFENQEGDNDV